MKLLGTLLNMVLLVVTTPVNLDFNMKLIQASSLSAADKAKYAEILSQATLTDPLYKDDGSTDNPSNLMLQIKTILKIIISN